MALAPEDIQRHTAKQTDVKNFIQLLTPLVSLDIKGEDDYVVKTKEAACKKMTELIGQITCGITESIIKPI